MTTHEPLPLFVYGTLLPGQPNAQLLAGAVVRSQPATFNGGRLFDMGAYPMLIEQDASPVVGRLLHLKRPLYHETVARLDALEGYDPTAPDTSRYRRLQRTVLVDGVAISCWLYLGSAEHTQGANLIPSGDWAAHSAGKLGDMNQWWDEFGRFLKH